METKLANRCAQKILEMEAARITKSYIDIIVHKSKRKEKIFWKGVPELNIESPFETIKKLLEDKGYILKPISSFLMGRTHFCIKCKNIKN